jgi:hypothetical protein
MCQALGQMPLVLCQIIRKVISLQGHAFKGKPPGPGGGQAGFPRKLARAGREFPGKERCRPARRSRPSRRKSRAPNLLQCLATLPRLPASASRPPSDLPGHAVVCGTALPSSRVPPRPSVPEQALLQDPAPPSCSRRMPPSLEGRHGPDLPVDNGYPLDEHRFTPPDEGRPPVNATTAFPCQTVSGLIFPHDRLQGPASVRPPSLQPGFGPCFGPDSLPPGSGPSFGPDTLPSGSGPRLRA